MMRAIGAFRAAHPDSRGARRRADVAAHPRRRARRRGSRSASCAGRSPTRTGSPRVPLARVPVDHVAVPPGHPLAGAEVVDAADLDGEPVLVVDRADAPTAHDEIEAYCAATGARPRWITHAAVQVERVLDLVAVGTGIGWLNSWQAERARRRTDVAVRPLQPVALYDEFRVVWRAGDDVGDDRRLRRRGRSVLRDRPDRADPEGRFPGPISAAAMEGSIDGRMPS